MKTKDIIIVLGLLAILIFMILQKYLASPERATNIFEIINIDKTSTMLFMVLYIVGVSFIYDKINPQAKDKS